MKLLFEYLKNYKSLLILALFLAAINQVFSLLDPLVLRSIIDNYAMKMGDTKMSTSEFLIGGGKLILLAMGVAMVSRIAKNFQDYYVNVITQRLGAQIYQDGLR